MRKASLLLTAIVGLTLAAAARAADSYTIDPAHTTIGFSVRHLGVSNVHGQFKEFSGAIVFDDKNPSASSVKVTIKTASIDTSNEKRDNHLKSASFFEAEKFPEITFASKSVEKKGDTYQMTGTLTMKGVSKDVVIPFTLSGPVQDPWKNTRLGAEGSLTINRQDYGVAMADIIDKGIGNDVKISLDVESTKDAPKK